MLGSNTLAITQLYKKEKYMKVLPSYNLAWLENKLTFGFGGKSSMPVGPQSKADIAAGGFMPKGTKQTKAGNPNIAKKQGAYASSTPTAIVNKQTADRNTMRRADAAIRRRTKPSLLNDNSYLSTLG
jgi:hypothetical protein